MKKSQGARLRHYPKLDKCFYLPYIFWYQLFLLLISYVLTSVDALFVGYKRNLELIAIEIDTWLFFIFMRIVLKLKMYPSVLFVPLLLWSVMMDFSTPLF